MLSYQILLAGSSPAIAPRPNCFSLSGNYLPYLLCVFPVGASDDKIIGIPDQVYSACNSFLTLRVIHRSST